MTNPIVKVINKDKEGATVKEIRGGTIQKIPWKEFDEYFKPTTKLNFYEMILTPDVEAEVKNIQERFRWLTPYFPQILMITNKKNKGIEPSLQEIFILGSISSEYHEKFPGLAPIQFIEDINSMKEYMLKGFLKL